jgi:serine phosphatase RsbU (regulator of sigma subunit)
MMPGMDGFETAEVIRRRDRTRYTPIVFVTAVGTDDEYVSRGYSAGAVDYLFKPVIPGILRSKVAAFVELFRKTEEIKRQEQKLREFERREHDAQLAEAERRIEAERLRTEMDVARQIQQQLFPAAAPICPGFEIAGGSYPAGPAGGDYFDYIPVAENVLDVVVGDVSGHGLGPALLMSATRAYLRALAPTHHNVGDVLAGLNRALCGDTASDQFITLLLVRLDVAARQIVYASAGHNSGFLLDAAGQVKSELPSTGMPLGILGDGEFETSPEKITLVPGDLGFLYTDGLVEAANVHGEQFGVAAALEVIRAQRSRPAIEIVNALHAAVIGFVGSGFPHDDMTAVVIKA